MSEPDSKPTDEFFGIKEIKMGDLIMLVPSNPCPVCDEEMENIVMFGDVCFKCDAKKEY